MFNINVLPDPGRERASEGTTPPSLSLCLSDPSTRGNSPGQVYSWDTTKLAGPIKGMYFDCDMTLEIYSRYSIGVYINDHESGQLAVDLIKEIFGVHGIPAVVHADRGTAMTSKMVAALLADLHVTRSHSRPRVPKDNPYSKA